MTKLQYPFDYSDLEPAAGEVARDDIRPGTYLTTQDVQAEAFAFSQAISLKRIADALQPVNVEVRAEPAGDAKSILTEIVTRLYLENEKGIGWRLGDPGGDAEDNYSLVQRAKELVFK